MMNENCFWFLLYSFRDHKSITKICRLVIMSVSLIQQYLSNTKNVCTLLWSPVVCDMYSKKNTTQSYEAYNCFKILSMIVYYACFDLVRFRYDMTWIFDSRTELSIAER